MHILRSIFPWRRTAPPSSETTDTLPPTDRVQAARAAIATITTFEEACAAERSASPHHRESWEIFRHRTNELTAQRIEQAQTLADLKVILSLHPSSFSRSKLTHCPMLRRWAQLSETSSDARKAFEWMQGTATDEATQCMVELKLDELVESESASAKTASDARDICIRGRQDSKAQANAAKRWFELCTTLDEARDLTQNSSLLTELGEPLRHAAWLRRRAIEYAAIRDAKNPAEAKAVFDRIDNDSPVKTFARERWDTLSLDEVESAKDDDALAIAFGSARHGSEAKMQAIRKMATRLQPAT